MTTLSFKVGRLSELLERGEEPGERSIRTLHIVDQSPWEVPVKMPENSISLDPFLSRFPNLEELKIVGHAFIESIQHDRLEKVTLFGAVALTELILPRCTHLRLAIGGDAFGVATAFESFAWLLSTDSLPELRSLDVRGLDVELMNSRSPTLLQRWASARVIRDLRYLGLGNQSTTRELKKLLVSFAHLDLLVVSGLLSAFDKNPVGANLLFEDSFPDVPLEEMREKIASLPSLTDLKPSLSEDAFLAILSGIAESSFRLERPGPLTRCLSAFCRRRQWQRIEVLLPFARKKSSTMRVFLKVRSELESEVVKVVRKYPDDEVAKALLERLVRQNAL